MKGLELPFKTLERMERIVFFSKTVEIFPFGGEI